MTPEQKAARIARAERHLIADMLRSNIYIDDTVSHGCSVGCDVIDIAGCDPGGNYHRIVADHDGTPEWLEHLRDVVFEGLPDDDARRQWHVDLARAIPTNTDLQPAYHLICAGILEIALEQRPLWPDPHAGQVESAIRDMIALHRSGRDSAAWSARSAAESAAWSAAESAASAAESAAESAASAAESAAESAASAAESAAWSAAESAASAAWSAARSAAYVRIAALTLDVLKATLPR